jgi:hypothetical protein
MNRITLAIVALFIMATAAHGGTDISNQTPGNEIVLVYPSGNLYPATALARGYVVGADSSSLANQVAFNFTAACSCWVSASTMRNGQFIRDTYVNVWETTGPDTLVRSNYFLKGVRVAVGAVDDSSLNLASVDARYINEGALLSGSDSLATRAYARSVDTNSGGDITSVVAGNGLTGGATSGAATANVVGGTWITVASDSITVNLTNTDARYVNEGQDPKIVLADTFLCKTTRSGGGDRKCAEVKAGLLATDIITFTLRPTGAAAGSPLGACAEAYITESGSDSLGFNWNSALDNMTLQYVVVRNP